MARQCVSTGTPWEPIVGYSRAVRVGNHVFVSGTTATDETGKLVGLSDPYKQAIQTLENVKRALEATGATMADVVRTRIYVLRMEDWEAIGRAHGTYFAEVLPATSMLEVGRLIDPRMLVEIEADAVIEEDQS